MKKIVVLFVSLLAVACTIDVRQLEPVYVVQQEITLTASSGEPDTRTERAADGAVLWSPGDQISLFYGSGENGGSCFTSQNTETASIAQFTGTIGVITGGSEVELEDKYFWAVYPYKATASCDGAAITTVLPANQVATADTFADDLFPTMGRSRGLSMAFYNICGGIKFTVSQEGITSVTLKGNSGEQIAGTITVGLDENNLPKVTGIADGSDTITLTAPEGQTFQVGKAYYFVLVPTVFENGFTLSFTKGLEQAVYSRTNETIIKRSVFGYISTPDYGLQWEIPTVSIPDDAFRQYMISNYDTNCNGALDLDEAEAITRITINTDNIHSVTGIEFCNNLEYLNCRGSSSKWDSNEQRYISSGQITELDLSMNSKLLSLSCDYNNISSIVLPNNSSLTYISCYSNLLQSLDVSVCPNLELLYCYSNRLSSLSVSSNTMLKELWCYANELASLDISNNPNLNYIDCCMNELTGIDLSHVPSLSGLMCYSNRLNSLDLSQATSISRLRCYSNQISSLDLSHCPNLSELYCYSNQLTSIDLTQCDKVKDIRCSLNQLTSLDLTCCSLLNFLDCRDNELFSLDLSNNSVLGSLYCYNNHLTSLILPENSTLKEIRCYSNQLTSIDISGCSALTILSCGGNKLTSIDVSQTVSLKQLYCSSNLISFLDLRNNTLLSSLDCSPMKGDSGNNLLDYVYLAYGQTISHVTTDRDNQYIPDETVITYSVAGISVSSTLALVVGEHHAMPEVLFTPYNAYNKNVSWSVDNASVVTIENGELIAMAEGTADLTATSVDGGFTANCQVTVYPGPITDFNSDSYLVWKQNANNNSSGDNFYHTESVFDGFQAPIVEMKIQLASSSDNNCTLASDNVEYKNYDVLSLSETHLRWSKIRNEEVYNSWAISLSDAGVTRTSLMTIRFDKGEVTINGNTFTVPFTAFDFKYLFARYSHESDEGIWESFDSIPDGSKVYYCKGWDYSGNLVYLGYPAIRNNEYCWYTYYNRQTTYQYANHYLSYGSFGGYIP